MTYRVKLGMEAKIYINDGTYAAPSWTEMGNAKDVTINLEKGEADVTVRDNNGWRAYAGTLKDGSVEFESLWISRHKGFRRIKKAYFRNESLEFAIMDGEITEPGVEGLRARMVVTNLSRGEPLEEGITASVTLKPTVSEHAPYWLETEEIDAGEPTTPAGANLYYDESAEKATFDDNSGANEFIGVTVQDYTTGETLVYFDSTAKEV